MQGRDRHPQLEHRRVQRGILILETDELPELDTVTIYPSSPSPEHQDNPGLLPDQQETPLLFPEQQDILEPPPEVLTSYLLATRYANRIAAATDAGTLGLPPEEQDIPGPLDARTAMLLLATELAPCPWNQSPYPWHKPQGLPEAQPREPPRDIPVAPPPLTSTPLLDSIITMEALYLDYDESLDKYHVFRDQRTLDGSSEARRKYIRAWQMVEHLHTKIINTATTNSTRMHWQTRLDTRIYVKDDRLVRGSNRITRTQELIALVELEDRVAVEREHQKRTAKLGPIQAGLRAELMQPTIKPPPVLQTETSPTHLRIWLARFKAYREGAKLDCCSRIVAFEHILTLLDDSLCKKVIADRLGKVETFGINEIVISIKKAFLLGYPMSIRRLTLIKHQRKHNEPFKDYFLRLQFNRVSASEDTKTPGEVML